VTVDVTVTPVNDAPVGQGDAVETPEDTPVSGAVTGSDVDGDELTFTLEDGPAHGTVTVNEDGTYTYTPDADYTGDDSFTVTVDDGNGGTDTVTVDVTVTPVNDAPEAEDDVSLTTDGLPVMLDLRDNDSDAEGDALTVTEVDGQPISVSSIVTLSGDRGTVTMAADGTLTFVPGPNTPETLELPYTVSDGNGGTDTATWTINIAGVDISDNTGPGGTADGVLSSVDDLTAVAISGHAAPGGEVTSLTISDGTNSVTVPAGDITVNADGTYSASADLSGLDDGTLTVTATIQDAAGNKVTTTDTIDKDTVTEVTIDPVLIAEGVAPTISGTGEVGAEISLTVGSDTYTTTVGTDGTWSVDLPAALGEADVSIKAEATDVYGNEATTSRDVMGLVVTDDVAGDGEDIRVSEAGLADGSDPAGGADSTSSTIVLGTDSAALDHVVIGADTFTRAQLQGAAGSPVDVDTGYGTLTITGFDDSTGTISYTYQLTDSTIDHGTAATDEIVRESIQIAVVETDGDTRVSALVVSVEDDVP
jgi:VCBS repeat-containing protein